MDEALENNVYVIPPSGDGDISCIFFTLGGEKPDITIDHLYHGRTSFLFTV
jgi:hypothetical protein